jgi:hypothetical protein
MAITPASFVPEKRGAQGPDNYSVGMAKNVDAAPPSAGTDSEQHAGWENYPATHSVTGMQIPTTSGAGKGSIMKGGRKGK